MIPVLRGRRYMASSAFAAPDDVEKYYVGMAASGGTSITYTFSGFDFGAERETRIIVVAVCSLSSTARAEVSVCTALGTSLSKISAIGTDASTVETSMWAGLVPTGTTGDVAITRVNGNQQGAAVFAYYILNAGDVATHDLQSKTGGASASLNIPAQGVAIGFEDRNSGSDTTWIGLDEDVDFLLNDGIGGGPNRYLSTASRFFLPETTGHTITTDSADRLITASWGP